MNIFPDTFFFANMVSQSWIHELWISESKKKVHLIRIIICLENITCSATHIMLNILFKSVGSRRFKEKVRAAENLAFRDI